jgi:hypothetical protein
MSHGYPERIVTIAATHPRWPRKRSFSEAHSAKIRHLTATASMLVHGLMTACGGQAAPPAPAAPQVRGGGSILPAPAAARQPNAPSPPPANLPAMAAMPAPGVRGSPVATVSGERAFETCIKRTRVVKNALEAAHSVGQGCSGVAKNHPIGVPLPVANSDSERASESSFRAESGKCYRVYSAHTSEVMETAIVLRDGAGNIIIDSPSDTIPQAGAFCFSAATQVTVTLAIGRGKGTFAAEVWGN